MICRRRVRRTTTSPPGGTTGPTRASMNSCAARSGRGPERSEDPTLVVLDTQSVHVAAEGPATTATLSCAGRTAAARCASRGCRPVGDGGRMRLSDHACGHCVVGADRTGRQTDAGLGCPLSEWHRAGAARCGRRFRGTSRRRRMHGPRSARPVLPRLRPTRGLPLPEVRDRRCAALPRGRRPSR